MKSTSYSLDQVLRLQSVWRGYHTRLMTDILKKASRLKKKYFLDEEFFETVSKTVKFNFKAKLIKKEHAYKCSGSKYVGEWRGGFRHGQGVMFWADGAKYDGQWELGKASGKGVFTHTKGEIYSGVWRNDKAHG